MSFSGLVQRLSTFGYLKNSWNDQVNEGICEMAQNVYYHNMTSITIIVFAVGLLILTGWSWK